MNEPRKPDAAEPADMSEAPRSETAERTEAAAAPQSAAERSAHEEWSEFADSLAGGEGKSVAAAEISRGAQRALFASALAVVLGIIAIAVTGMLWWQYRQFYVSLDETDASAAQQLERVRAEQRALRDELETARMNLDQVRQQETTLGERIDAVPSRFAEVERRLDAVQGGSFDARGNLLRSEAEYYLTVANTELTLAGNWDNAITALGLADGRLAELADPELAPVREAIAGELQTLRSLRLPDIEGIVFSLGRLASRADALTLRADLPQNFADRAASDAEAEPGLGRLWASVKRTLLGLVRVERRDDPVPQALSAAERLLNRRELALEIELARVAALRGEQQAYGSGLDAAIGMLEKDFDTDAADVEGALTLLKELRAFDINPARPDVSGSLTLLRARRTETQ